MHLLLVGASLQKIMDEQFYLASESNISLFDSNSIPDFEREVYVNALMKRIQQQNKQQ